MQFLREEELRKEERKRAGARQGLRLAGVILLVVGFVLTAFLFFVAPGEPVWMIGGFPFGIGVVLLAFSLSGRSA
jgi:hypothetical protein